MSLTVPILRENEQGKVYDKFPIDFLNNRIDENIIDSKIVTIIEDTKEYYIVILDNVFSIDECNEIINYSEQLKFDSLESIYSKTYRNNDRIMIQDIQFATKWYDRMEANINEYLNKCENNFERKGLNNLIRVCKYESGGIFQKHRDASISYNNLISRYTVMAYLNDVNETDGGATRFYENGLIKHKIQPKAGSLVIFPHQLLHDGELCTSPTKYLMRSDLMF